MATTLEVFYLTEELEMRSYGYRPAIKQRRAVKEDSEPNAFFILCSAIILDLHCQIAAFVLLTDILSLITIQGSLTPYISTSASVV
jgi:hypothetical protein